MGHSVVSVADGGLAGEESGP